MGAKGRGWVIGGTAPSFDDWITFVRVSSVGCRPLMCIGSFLNYLVDAREGLESECQRPLKMGGDDHAWGVQTSGSCRNKL